MLLLLGRVGSGKTTFLHHFLRLGMKRLLDKHLFVSFDFRLLEPGGGIREFLVRQKKSWVDSGSGNLPSE